MMRSNAYDSPNVDITRVYVLWHREHISLVSRNITQVGVKFHCDQILNSNNLSRLTFVSLNSEQPLAPYPAAAYQLSQESAGAYYTGEC